MSFGFLKPYLSDQENSYHFKVKVITLLCIALSQRYFEFGQIIAKRFY